MYVLARSGVYLHEVLCVTTTEERARELRKKALKVEPDSWHDIDIIEVPLDYLPTLTNLKTRKTFLIDEAIEKGEKLSCMGVKDGDCLWDETKIIGYRA